MPRKIIASYKEPAIRANLVVTPSPKAWLLLGTFLDHEGPFRGSLPGYQYQHEGHYRLSQKGSLKTTPKLKPTIRTKTRFSGTKTEDLLLMSPIRMYSRQLGTRRGLPKRNAGLLG